MSNTENTATIIKNKKNQSSNTESSTGNFVIPLVLLLVSAIVIVATFYQDEYVDMLASSDSPLTSVEATATNEASNKPAAESSALATVSHEAKKQSSDQAAKNPGTVTASQTVTQVTTKASPSVIENTKDTNHSIVVVEANISEQKTGSLVTKQVAKPIARKMAKQTQPAKIPADTPLVLAASQHDSTRPDSPSKVDHESIKKQSNEHYSSPVQQQQAKRKEIMLQRRQAYEKEMQSRRQQYEAAKKAHEEKRAQIIEAKNALFIRVQQHHSETRQTIEQARKRLAELHEELYQIMMQSRNTRPQPTATQIKDIEVEKM